MYIEFLTRFYEISAIYGAMSRVPFRDFCLLYHVQTLSANEISVGSAKKKTKTINHDHICYQDLASITRVQKTSQFLQKSSSLKNRCLSDLYYNKRNVTAISVFGTPWTDLGVLSLEPSRKIIKKKNIGGKNFRVVSTTRPQHAKMCPDFGLRYLVRTVSANRNH